MEKRLHRIYTVRYHTIRPIARLAPARPAMPSTPRTRNDSESVATYRLLKLSLKKQASRLHVPPRLLKSAVFYEFLGLSADFQLELVQRFLEDHNDAIGFRRLLPMSDRDAEEASGNARNDDPENLDAVSS